jgi:hypothetical protein
LAARSYCVWHGKARLSDIAIAIGLFGLVGIARKKLVKGGHDVAAL